MGAVFGGFGDGVLALTGGVAEELLVGGGAAFSPVTGLACVCAVRVLVSCTAVVTLLGGLRTFLWQEISLMTTGASFVFERSGADPILVEVWSSLAGFCWFAQFGVS